MIFREREHLGEKPPPEPIAPHLGTEDHPADRRLAVTLVAEADGAGVLTVQFDDPNRLTVAREAALGGMSHGLGDEVPETGVDAVLLAVDAPVVGDDRLEVACTELVANHDPTGCSSATASEHPRISHAVTSLGLGARAAGTGSGRIRT